MPLTTTTTPQSLRETLEETIGPELAGALEKKGFDRLTPVQEAVLRPDLQGRDLRISSQTGSGKTVAIGLALRDDVARPVSSEEGSEAEEASSSGNLKGRDQRAQPRAFVVTPTRELAKQVEEELAWLYAPLGARIASVTGGGGYRDELRAFRAKPAIIVGTPGRLLDHLKRGAIDASHAGTVVFDEADRMLDLGFREDLEAILGFAPKDHRTHLVSATFPREVRALADRVQKDAVPVEGTPLGTANLDIEHVIHLVHPRERLGAIINLLLENPGAQSLVFARTRADVADIADALGNAGFNIAMLSGEMEQAERNRALAAFKRGNVDALVATDVAARGIDVQDVTRVIHAEPPTDADAYTHRSGRTGRAGKKGISSVLVTERELPRTVGLLGRARVRWSFAPIPSADALREAADRNLLSGLTADFIEGETIDERSLALAERILATSEPARAVGRLVALAVRRTRSEPQEITPIAPPTQRGAGAARRKEYGRGDRFEGRADRFEGRAERFEGRAERFEGHAERFEGRAERFEGARGERRGGDRQENGEWVPFRVSWGESHGADPRRLVAMMCRRGKIEGRDIGAIRVGRTSSVVEVSSNVAADFEHATAKPDPRDPRVHVRRWSEEPVGREQPAPKSHGFGDRKHEAARGERARDGDADRKARGGSSDRETVDAPTDQAPRGAPKDRPSVAKDRPSVPKDRPSVPKDRPSVPKDRPSVPKDRPSLPKDR
ncbi:MAG TPA: DEAD/DEAH box helicase, partial [Labilithrix sp.]|nr:DEAD/DEAH box helicase [Labilithrix sp.]